MELSHARLQLGIVDACGGGSWTGTKGLVADAAPFALPDIVDSQGAAWIASTSGSEEAHEAEVVEGSLFTHHLVMGLRGAADESSEGQVTLSEAFAYAKRHTTRDAALLADAAQTPSYHLQLRGKRDVVLTTVDAGETEVQLSQEVGPLQVLHVESGVALLELPPGSRTVRLALAPGDYVVRRITDDGVLAKSLTLRAGDTVFVPEESLELHASAGLAAKGPGVQHVGPTETLAPSGQVLASTWFRQSMPQFAFGAAWSPHPRFQVWWPGGVTARLGNSVHEVVPWIGSLGLRRNEEFRYKEWVGEAAWGTDYRTHLNAQTSLMVGFQAGWSWTGVTGSERPSALVEGSGVRFDGSKLPVVVSHTVAERVTLNVGVTIGLPFGRRYGDKLGMALSVLPELRRGGRPLPLMQVHVHDRMTLDVTRQLPLFHVGRQGVFRNFKAWGFGATFTL